MIFMVSCCKSSCTLIVAISSYLQLFTLTHIIEETKWP